MLRESSYVWSIVISQLMYLSRPTPLDALIASHIYAIFSLDSSSRLRTHIETKSSLDDYVERVLSHAGSKLI